jgi:hypothetical protein
MSMVQLLIADSAPPPLTPDHRFGGLPLVPEGAEFVWPRCKSCHGLQQFLGRFRIPGKPKLVLLYMCQNNPGLCAEWQADAGGNCATVVPAERLTEVKAPTEGIRVRESAYGAREIAWPDDDYDNSREAWSHENGRPRRDVLGQVLGQPLWLQADETPKCKDCGQRMGFLAQLEQGPDWQTEMNFGGGCAYLFDCSCNGHSAKFLWQC